MCLKKNDITKQGLVGVIETFEGKSNDHGPGVSAWNGVWLVQQVPQGLERPREPFPTELLTQLAKEPMGAVTMTAP